MRQNDFIDSDDLCQYVSGSTGRRCILSFSCGKDAVAAWVQLRKDFDRILPVYLYLVPGLSFVERSLTYYESAFGCKIVRMPQPALYRMLNGHVFAPPSSRKAIRKLRLPNFDHDDVFRVVREDHPEFADSYVAVGVRALDSLSRRATVKRYGPVNHRRRQFFPVYDWSKQDVMDAVRDAGLRLAEDYRVWGRSFDGLHYPFLRPLKEHYPDDYEKVRELFPLCDLELLRGSV